MSERARAHTGAPSAPLAARSTRRCASCRAPQREAMFEIYSFCRAVDDIADDPGPRDARRAQLAAVAQRISTRVYRGAAPAQLAGLAQAVRDIRSRARGFHRHHRRHGDGRRRRHPRARLRRRSTSIAIASPARSAGFRCACSAWSRTPALRSRIISAARCSSPTFCATSTRTPALGRLYLPREALQAAGIAATEPAVVAGAVRRSRKPARRSSQWPKAQFREAAGDHGEEPAPRGARAAHHGRGLSHHSAKPDRARLRSAARASAPAACEAHSASCLRNLVVMSGTIHIIGAGLAGLSAAVRLHVARRAASSCTRRPLSPAAAAAPITTPSVGMTIDNGNHLLLSGNHAALGLSAQHRRRSTG